MTEQHPITPPPELVQQWSYDWHRAKVKHVGCAEYIATQAARWGADQELKACEEWLPSDLTINGESLRAARRPKPPSLAEQAIAELQSHRTELRSLGKGFYSPAINAALERLQELENNG